MAQLIGPIRFTGSVGNIRSYYDSRVKKYIVSTKGGASRELILNNPEFARTRENMNDFSACSMWASLLRKALISMSALFRGNYFNNIMKYAKRIQKFDVVNPRGSRMVESSKYARMLQLIRFNEDQPFDLAFCFPLQVSLSEDKKRVTLKILGFRSYGHLYWKSPFQSYRFTMVIAQLADMVWDKTEKKFTPTISDLEQYSETVSSKFYNRSTEEIDIILEASFAEPALQHPGTTVVVALGVEVSGYNNTDPYLSIQSGTMQIVECFV